MNLKEKVHQHYLKLLNGKIGLIQKVLADLKESGANETKSTAGDKHETSLAMIQIEQANKRDQLAQLVSQKLILEKINPNIVAPIVVMGSLIKTDKGYLFMTVALGKAIVEGINLIALSPQSPLGMKLMGLKEKDTVIINNVSYFIESIQ